MSKEVGRKLGGTNFDCAVGAPIPITLVMPEVASAGTDLITADVADMVPTGMSFQVLGVAVYNGGTATNATLICGDGSDINGYLVSKTIAANSEAYYPLDGELANAITQDALIDAAGSGNFTVTFTVATGELHNGHVLVWIVPYTAPTDAFTS